MMLLEFSVPGLPAFVIRKETCDLKLWKTGKVKNTNTIKWKASTR